MKDKEALKKDILQQLPHFTGTENMWKHNTPFGSLLLTDGSNYIREAAQCRWLFDLIRSYQGTLNGVDFQSWKLKKNKGDSCVITCDDGNGKELARERIPYTSFPLDEINIWLIDGTCLLPGEY